MNKSIQNFFVIALLLVISTISAARIRKQSMDSTVPLTNADFSSGNSRGEQHQEGLGEKLQQAKNNIKAALVHGVNQVNQMSQEERDEVKNQMGQDIKNFKDHVNSGLVSATNHVRNMSQEEREEVKGQIEEQIKNQGAALLGKIGEYVNAQLTEQQQGELKHGLSKITMEDIQRLFEGIGAKFEEFFNNHLNNRQKGELMIFVEKIKQASEEIMNNLFALVSQIYNEEGKPLPKEETKEHIKESLKDRMNERADQ